MRVIDSSGDTKIIWDPAEEAEVTQARQTFAGLKEQGYIAYQVDVKGRKGDVVDTFDPDAEKLILAPPISGG